MQFHDLVNQNYKQLSENDLALSRFIDEHKEAVKQMNIKDFSRKSLSSKSSVIRFAQKLGFTGFGELRNFLKWETSGPEAQLQLAFREQVVRDTEKTLRYIQESNWEDIYQAIDQCRTIYLISTGVTQKSQATELQRLFLLIGKPAQIIPGGDAKNEIRRILEYVNKDDLLFLLSLSGENTGLLDLLNILSIKEAKIVSITNFKDNSLSGRSDYSLYANSSRSPLPEDWWLQTSSTFFMLIEAFAFGYVDYQRKAMRNQPGLTERK